MKEQQLPPEVLERFRQSPQFQFQQQVQGVAPAPAQVPPEVLERFRQQQIAAQRPSEPSLYDSVVESLGKAGLAVRNALTGDLEREHDYPELQQNISVGGERVPIQDRLALAHGNPVKMGVLAHQLVPNADVQFDKFGNPHIRTSDVTGTADQRAYLNRPGLSPADVSQTAVNAVNELTGAVPAGRAGGAVAGLVGRAVGTGAGLAGASAAEDVAAGFDVDPQRAALLGGLGTIGEFAAPVVSRLLDRIVGSDALMRDGRLTERGYDLLRQAGIAPGQISDEFLQRWAQTARNAVDPAEAARVAQAETLPVPVPLSRGDITRNPNHQRFESEAQKGVRGEQARAEMSGFRDSQNAALWQNADEVQRAVGGRAPGSPAIESPAGMQMAQRAVGGQRDALKSAVNEAYDMARAENASVVTEGARGLARYMNAAVSEGFDTNSAPKALGILADMASEFGTQNLRSVTVRRLESFRAKLSNLSRSSDKVEATAAGTATRAYDAFMRDFLEEAMVRGSDEAIEAFRQARGLRARLAREFEDDKLLAKVIEKDRRELLRTPEEALNLLFSANQLGAKQGAVRTLRQMRRLLGPGSAEWRALKEEAFLKLLKNQNRNQLNEAMTPVFSGDRFASQLNRAMQDHPSLMRSLFTADEIRLLRQFRDVAQRATNRVEGAVNHSNTSISLQSILGQLFGPASRIIEVVAGRMYRAVEPEIQRGGVRRATGYRPAQRDLVPAGATGTAAGNTGLGVYQSNQ